MLVRQVKRCNKGGKERPKEHPKMIRNDRDTLATTNAIIVSQYQNNLQRKQNFYTQWLQNNTLLRNKTLSRLQQE
jgi:hypothetical protein